MDAIYDVKRFMSADVSVVAEGQVNYHNTKRLPYGGRDLDAFLVSLLKQRGVHCNDPQKLKEMCARASGLPAPDSEVSERGNWLSHNGSKRSGCSGSSGEWASIAS